MWLFETKSHFRFFPGMCCGNRRKLQGKSAFRVRDWSAKQPQGQGRGGRSLTQRTEVKERICKSRRLPGTPDEDPIRVDRCLHDPGTR